jgi:hypothetical protein
MQGDDMSVDRGDGSVRKAVTADRSEEAGKGGAEDDAGLALPSAEVGRQVFLALCGSPLRARHWSSGLVRGDEARLVSFRPVRSRLGWFRGVQVCRLEYEAWALVVQDLLVESPLPGHWTVYRTGCRLIERGSLTFERTGAGWQAEDGRCY